MEMRDDSVQAMLEFEELDGFLVGPAVDGGDGNGGADLLGPAGNVDGPGGPGGPGGDRGGNQDGDGDDDNEDDNNGGGDDSGAGVNLIPGPRAPLPRTPLIVPVPRAAAAANASAPVEMASNWSHHLQGVWAEQEVAGAGAEAAGGSAGADDGVSPEHQ